MKKTSGARGSSLGFHLRVGIVDHGDGVYVKNPFGKTMKFCLERSDLQAKVLGFPVFIVLMVMAVTRPVG